MSETVNIAAFLPEIAKTRPHAPAIIFPEGRDQHGKRAYTHYTYAQLNAESDAIARGLALVGVGQGVRTALMVKPSLEFFALTFGLFKAGAVPILVDPGIGPKRVKACLAEAQPEAFIGIPLAHLARMILGWGRGTIKTQVTVGRRWIWGGETLAGLRAAGRAAIKSEGGYTLAPTQAQDMAAILFTSGSTGVPKGVVYDHRHFVKQVELIRDAYDIKPGEIDLPTFPLFALFDPALGMTTVIPDMDPTKPASVNPEVIVEAMSDFGATNMFGSPALLDTVSRYCVANNVQLPSLKRIISAGAPVPVEIHERMAKVLPPGAEVHTPYGATECLPVATVSSHEILGGAAAKTAAGAGTCVGKPNEANDVQIIAIDDGPLPAWDDLTVLPVGEIGEIIVRGPTTTQSYFNRDASTKLAKIAAPDGGDSYHRMGDIGYFDEDGRLWFCGRKTQRVRTATGDRHTTQIEMVFNTHVDVFRTALVGVGAVGSQRPVLCVELDPASSGADKEAVRKGLLAIAAGCDVTRGIDTFLFHPGFPVDVRHNAKIGREELAGWAAGKLP